MHTIRSVYWLLHKVCLLLTKITLVQCSCEQLAKLVDTVKVHQYHKVSTGFSQHTVCRSQIKSSQKLQKLNRRFTAMCFPAGERRVWSPPWIHCWCWTAPSGSPPRCSARPWGGERCSRRPGWSCPYRQTRRESTSHSLARCSDPRTASFSDEVWNQSLPGPSIRECVWQQVEDDHAMIKIQFLTSLTCDRNSLIVPLYCLEGFFGANNFPLLLSNDKLFCLAVKSQKVPLWVISLGLFCSIVCANFTKFLEPTLCEGEKKENDLLPITLSCLVFGAFRHLGAF